MKFTRMISIVLVLLLSCGLAIAEIDWASMSDAELEDELAKGMTEMMNRGMYIGEPEYTESTPEPTAEPKEDNAKNPNKRTGKATLLDVEGVKVIATVFEVVTDDWIYNPELLISYTVENNSSKDFEAHIDKSSINDWEVDHTGYIDVGAGKKAKDTIKLKMEDADVSTLGEIEKVTFSFTYDKGDYNYVTTKPKNIKLK